MYFYRLYGSHEEYCHDIKGETRVQRYPGYRVGSHIHIFLPEILHVHVNAILHRQSVLFLHAVALHFLQVSQFIPVVSSLGLFLSLFMFLCFRVSRPLDTNQYILVDRCGRFCCSLLVNL